MPRTVLIVDDERDTNDILAAMAQARDFKPIQLFSGSQVFNAVREHAPDLILLDLMLPDIDGFAICDQPEAQSRDEPDPDHHGHGPARSRTIAPRGSGSGPTAT